ncbi:MAG: aminotransferase class V-fold PLP-dependent enzyme [Candidatus Krumholzibacteriota bacterium]|nr:aminotransferase class V-fold PLP-dependent enzyme [Candidatus Krumholzibacteriota bacterium]
MWEKPDVDESEIEKLLGIFLEEYPEYAETAILDQLRHTEYSRLDTGGHIYLDYTGGGLYSDSQIRDHMDFLLHNVLGNPHSSNPTSAFCTEKVKSCRERVLNYFNASLDEYVLIFTANASHALKLVGEAYPFEKGDELLLSFDNHNSVLGIREFDRARGASTKYVPVIPPDLTISRDVLVEYLEDRSGSKNRLFAYPAQSNFSGVQHPLDWIGLAQARDWDVLLDAAAFVPTNRLDLSVHKPDYVAISFYKIFGFPTGIGCLIARRKALEKLHRPWFAGGTITVASVQADQHYLAPGSEGFEDGTLDYANLPAVGRGLDYIDSIGIDTIHKRVECLVDWLIKELIELKHGNGRALIRLYGPVEKGGRGGTVTINIYDREGAVIDHTLIEQKANLWKISLRTGCFCNPGAGEMALGLSKNEMITCMGTTDSRMTIEEFRQCIDGKSTGAVRVSVGIASNFRDVAIFLKFVSLFIEN